MYAQCSIILFFERRKKNSSAKWKVIPTVEYELLDFGDGRKLERIGDYCLDRPSPAAEGTRVAEPNLWETVDFRFDRRGESQGAWTPRQVNKVRWHVDGIGFRLQLKPTPFGHIGLFPEQWTNWEWVADQVRRQPTPPRLLNLFAYTGGTTLAAAAAGAHVVHVDSARNIVQWARENAALSQLTDAPIRWITEDVRRFVQREVRRGNQYEAIVLDPPTYGHGPKGETWKIGRDLFPLLRACKQLLTDRPAFFLITCHSPGFGAAETGAMLQETLFGRCSASVRARSLHLTSRDGRRLDAGVVARWPPQRLSVTSD